MPLFHLVLVVLPIWLTIVALPASAQQSNESGWSKIRTDQGAAVDFPGHIFTKQASSAEQTVKYTTEDGRGTFSLFSTPNTRRESPAQFLRHADKGEDRLDYKRVTGNFLAASTIRNGQVIYRRAQTAD